METRLLKAFRAVAKHGGLVGAARELHLTRSALSHSLRSLEDEVGCRLFEREGRRLVLNQAGEQLLAGVEEPLRSIERTAAAVKDLGRWGQGRLRIGAAVAACQHLLPPVLCRLRRENPNLHLRVETGDMPSLLEGLQDRTIDLALGVVPEATVGLEIQPLFDDELLFVFAASHPWADGRPLSAAEVARETLIVCGRATPTTRLVERHLRNLGYEPRATLEVASVAVIKELVRLGLGVSVLAPWMIDTELVRGVLQVRPIGPRLLRRRWVLASLAGYRLGLAEERFARWVRLQASGLRRDRRDLPSVSRGTSSEPGGIGANGSGRRNGNGSGNGNGNGSDLGHGHGSGHGLDAGKVDAGTGPEAEFAEAEPGAGASAEKPASVPSAGARRVNARRRSGAVRR